VDVTHHDTSTSTRHPFVLDFVRKNEKVYDLEVFCEVVRLPGVNRDFLWGGYEVISGNKYFLLWCPNFFNDRPLFLIPQKSRIIIPPRLRMLVSETLKVLLKGKIKGKN
jgi:hypothetical protein